MSAHVPIQTCLWFVDDAQAAVDFYCSVFPRSRVLRTTRYPGGGRMPEGTVLTIEFELDGVPFTALNGGVAMPPSPAVSLMVACDTQAELDALWSRLCADPASAQCGWLTDRWGYSWQLVPRRVMALLQAGTGPQRARMVDALMTMKKLDIAALEAAHAAAA